jgi:mono/diheme cytochrome c family protein
MRLTIITSLILVAAMFAAHPAAAQGARPGNLAAFQTGDALFHGVCQGCHMPDAKGAVGAGKYPALAANKNLETAGYPVAVIVHGQKAMPWFGEMLTDAQIANVVNYIRTNFGNHYTDMVKPQDVHNAR